MTRAFLCCTVVLVLAMAAAIAPATAQFPLLRRLLRRRQTLLPSPAPRRKSPRRRDQTLPAIGAANSHRSTIRRPTNSSSPLAPKGPRRSIPISIAPESLHELDRRNHMSFLSKSSSRAEFDKGGRCPDGTITVARQGDTLVLTWFGSIQGKPIVAYGTLSKK